MQIDRHGRHRHCCSFSFCVVDFLVGVHRRALDRRIGGAESRGGDGIAGLHGGDDVGAEGLVSGHGWIRGLRTEDRERKLTTNGH